MLARFSLDYKIAFYSGLTAHVAPTLDKPLDNSKLTHLVVKRHGETI